MSHDEKVSTFFLHPEGSEIFDSAVVKDAVADARHHSNTTPIKGIVVVTDDPEGGYSTDIIAFPKAEIPDKSVIERYRHISAYRVLEDNAQRDTLTFPEPYRTLLLLGNFLVSALENEDTETVSYIVGMMFSLIPEVEVLGMYIEYGLSPEYVDVQVSIKFSYLEMEKTQQ